MASLLHQDVLDCMQHPWDYKSATKGSDTVHAARAPQSGVLCQSFHAHQVLASRHPSSTPKERGTIRCEHVRDAVGCSTPTVVRSRRLPSAISIALEAAAAAIAPVPIWSKRPSTNVLPSWAVNVGSGDSSQLETISSNGLPHGIMTSRDMMHVTWYVCLRHKIISLNEE